jgi:hypothetical protein
VRLFFILLLFTPFAAAAQSDTLLKDFDMLTGCWITTDSTSGIRTGEYWEKQNDRMRGYGFAIKGTDTTVFEYFEVLATFNTLVYLAHPDDQEPAAFWESGYVSTEVGTQWHFENPEHDFPSKLSYFINPDGLYIAVKGSDGEGWGNSYTRIETWRFKPPGW